jgi:hypothetical protein
LLLGDSFGTIAGTGAAEACFFDAENGIASQQRSEQACQCCWLDSTGDHSRHLRDTEPRTAKHAARGNARGIQKRACNNRPPLPGSAIGVSVSRVALPF